MLAHAKAPVRQALPPQPCRSRSRDAAPFCLAPRACQRHQQQRGQQRWRQRQSWRQRELCQGRQVWAAAQPVSSQGEEDLHEQIEAAAAEAAEGLQGVSIYLVGMMGSGKSTVGRLLSEALKYCFFDTDALIEQAVGKPVPQIFAEDGEEAFRELETKVIRELSPFRDCVVATGGGLPTRGANWGHLHGGITVWLNGPPTLLAHRVIGDGTETRPLLAAQEVADAAAAAADGAYRQAVDRLSHLLEQRKEQYGESDIMVSLEGSGPTAELGAPAPLVALRVLLALDDRIRRDAAERARRMEFEIVGGELPRTMRVVRAPTAGAEDDDPLLP